jgi:AraC-like DNA-binding protein
MNDDDALRWEAEKRAILIALCDLGELFVPESDAPENVRRRQAFADNRTEVERLLAIPDWSMVRNLYRAAAMFADGFLAVGAIARDSLAMNDEMLAELSSRGTPAARGFSERQIRAKVQELRKRLDQAPTRALVASELHTSEATLKRALKDLGLGPWPPAPPED